MSLVSLCTGQSCSRHSLVTCRSLTSFSSCCHRFRGHSRGRCACQLSPLSIGIVPINHPPPSFWFLGRHAPHLRPIVGVASVVLGQLAESHHRTLDSRICIVMDHVHICRYVVVGRPHLVVGLSSHSHESLLRTHTFRRRHRLSSRSSLQSSYHCIVWICPSQYSLHRSSVVSFLESPRHTLALLLTFRASLGFPHVR